MSAMDTSPSQSPSQTPPHRHAYRAADAVLRSHTPTSQFGKSALVRQCLDGSAFAPPTKQRERKADAAASLRCCAACLRPGATRRCGRCGKASYCSKDCQRQDWARHKKTCLGRDDALSAPIASLTSELSNVFRLGEDALRRAGLPNPSVSWSKEVLEALCDCCLLPGLQLVPSDDRPHEGLGLGLRTIALLFLRYGATPTPKLLQMVLAHKSVESGPGTEDPAAYIVARARMGPETFPSGHPLRGPCDDALIRLGPLLRHASSVQLPPEPLLGLGSGEDDRVEIIEALLRSLAYVQEPAPSGKVDLVQR